MFFFSFFRIIFLINTFFRSENRWQPCLSDPHLSGFSDRYISCASGDDPHLLFDRERQYWLHRALRFFFNENSGSHAFLMFFLSSGLLDIQSWQAISRRWGTCLPGWLQISIQGLNYFKKKKKSGFFSITGKSKIALYSLLYLLLVSVCSSM